jgi:hypothetical protein
MISLAEVTEPKVDQAITWGEKAAAISVADQQSHDLACEWIQAIKELRQRAEDHHRPSIQAAHKAHQEALKALASINDPLDEAEKVLKKKVGAYIVEQQRVEALARAKAEAEARRQAEEERERELAQAEAEGADAEEISAMIAAPLVVAPARVEPAFQQAKGVSVAANWKGEVTSLGALVKAVAENKASIGLVMPNETAINQLAKATRGTLVIPGIRFFSESVVRAGRR